MATPSVSLQNPSLAEMTTSLERGPQLHVSIPGMVKILASIIIGLSLASFITQFYKLFVMQGDSRVVNQIIGWLNVNSEGSIPTWYSTTTLVFCALLLAVIALSKKAQNERFVLHWLALAAVFAYLSLDEMVKIHERFFTALREAVSISTGSGYVLALGALLVVMAGIFLMVYRRFIAALPKRLRYLTFIAAVVFLLGALGTDTMGDYLRSTFGDDALKSPAYLVVLTVEETLEMTGVLIFIYVLLSYIQTNVGAIHLHVGGAKNEQDGHL